MLSVVYVRVFWDLGCLEEWRDVWISAGYTEVMIYD